MKIQHSITLNSGHELSLKFFDKNEITSNKKDILEKAIFKKQTNQNLNNSEEKALAEIEYFKNPFLNIKDPDGKSKSIPIEMHDLFTLNIFLSGFISYASEHINSLATEDAIFQFIGLDLLKIQDMKDKYFKKIEKEKKDVEGNPDVIISNGDSQ